MQGSALVHQLRKVISLVDMLRDIGLDKHLSLPKVVVLGNQSSGKSSLVQQIVGLDFLPRGNGVVTRRPLQLRMNNIPNLKQPYAEFDQVVLNGTKKKFTNFNQVRKMIEQVTANVCQASKNIKDIPIVLNIYSDTCPNLTIVDLPGITLIPVQDQPQNIYQITKQMAIRYISQPRSIILCVIPANQDITNSEALHIMRKIDPNGDRSIGCLTKIDIMNRGDDATKMLKNQEVPLKYGYVGVKNRSQWDIQHNVPVSESLKAEKQFFTKSPIYSRLSADLFSTESLTRKLTTILYQQIKHAIPQILIEIKNKKNNIQEQLKKIGPGIAQTQEDLIKYAWKSVSNFMKTYKNSINGIKSAFYNADPVSSQIREQLTNIYKEQYDEPATANLSDKDIQNAVNTFFGGSTMLNFPTIDAFLYLLNPLLKKLQAPAYSANNRINQILENEANNVIRQNMMQKFPDFNKKFNEVVKKILEKHKKQLQIYLQMLLQAQISYLYTNDNNYLQRDYTMSDKQRKKVESGKVKEPIVFQLRKRIDSYFKLVVRNLKDLVPKQIMNFMLVKYQKELQFQAYQFINDTKKLKLLLTEPQQITSKRIQYNKTLKILQQSQKRIKMDPDIAKLTSTVQKSRKIQTIIVQKKQKAPKKQNQLTLDLKESQVNEISAQKQQQNKAAKDQQESVSNKQKQKLDNLQSLFGKNIVVLKKKQQKLINDPAQKQNQVAKNISFSQLWQKLGKQKNKNNQNTPNNIIQNPSPHSNQSPNQTSGNSSRAANSFQRIFGK